MFPNFVPLLLVSLTALAVVTLAVYYVTNAAMRRRALRRAAPHAAMELATGTAVLGFVTPIASALLLGPVLSDLLARPRVFSATEDAAYLTLCLIAGLVAMSGTGMHAAGRAIDALIPAEAPALLRRTAGLYHRPLGHYPVHFGWTLANAGLALVAAGHPPVQAFPIEPLVAAGFLQGAVRAASILDGRTWKLLLPTEIASTLIVSWRISTVGASPEATYFLLSLLAGSLSLVAWGFVHRGFPATSRPRSGRDLLVAASNE